MTLSRRRVLAGFPTILALAAGRRAGAVVVPESTWRAEGLKPFIALAHQPQFAALVALSEDGGDEWNIASSTWIGNFGGVGYLLTAAHVFDKGEGADHFLYRTQGGEVLNGTRLIVHPLYNGDGNIRGGYDAALVRLDGPVNDSGSPPLLFARQLQGGERITFVGFGNRGTGTRGERDDFDTPEDNKTAAENTVDEVMDPVDSPPQDDEAGNWIRITLHRKEDGGRRLDGLLGSGDSGGSAWLRTADGRWGIVGVNVSGTGNATYGEHSFFAAIPGLRPWLGRVLPGLRFVG